LLVAGLLALLPWTVPAPTSAPKTAMMPAILPIRLRFTFPIPFLIAAIYFLCSVA